jgi:hypothetical protein
MSFAHNRLVRARRFAAVAALAMIAAVAAGCGSPHGNTDASATSRSPAAAWHRVVLCARAHGMPNLPDPQISDNGQAIFPAGLVVPQETPHACQSLYDRLVPNSRDEPPTHAQLAALLRFARCMRDHGIADWPDPRPDGTFPPDTRILHSLKSMFRTQLMTCEHLNPDRRGRVYFSQS